MKRLTWIDSLKGIAILFIIALHCGSEGLPRNVCRLLGTGSTWVQPFLLISVILALSSFERVAGQGLNFRIALKWTCGRFTKLAPLYYLAMGLALVCCGGAPYWLGSEGHVSGWNVLFHVFFAHGLVPHYANSILAVEWYLGVLAVLFVITPVIWLWVRDLSRAFAVCVAVVLGCHFVTELAYVHLLPRIVDRDVGNGFVSAFWFVASFPTVCLGVILFHMLKRRVEMSRTVALGAFVLALMLWHGLLRGHNSILYFKPQFLYAVVFAIIILVMSRRRIVLVDNVVFSFFGRHSYGLYLFHMTVIGLCQRVDFVGGWAGRYCCVLFAALVITLFAERLESAARGKWRMIFKGWRAVKEEGVGS